MHINNNVIYLSKLNSGYSQSWTFERSSISWHNQNKIENTISNLKLQEDNTEFIQNHVRYNTVWETLQILWVVQYWHGVPLVHPSNIAMESFSSPFRRELWRKLSISWMLPRSSSNQIKTCQDELTRLYDIRPPNKLSLINICGNVGQQASYYMNKWKYKG